MKRIAAIAAVLCLLLSACAGRNTYTLTLPQAEALTAITLERDGARCTLDRQEDMAALLQRLEGRTTRQESIQDAPVGAEELVTIELEHRNPSGQSVLFVYKKKGGYCLEQPYNGIYEISEEDYAALTDGLS